MGKSVSFKRLRLLFFVLYFLSGFAGLVYEVVWLRWLGLKFGVTSLAVGSVLAAFMLGLAWGAAFWGRRLGAGVFSRRSPLLLYAALELGVGFYGLAFPYLLEGADKLYLSFFSDGQPAFLYLAGGRFLLSLLLIFPPTALMGGTLPVLTAFFAPDREQTGREVGYLYGVNILGAVAGCFGAGFFFLSVLGVSGTNYLAAGLSLLIGVSAGLAGSVPGGAQPARPGEGEGGQAGILPFSGGRGWSFLIALTACAAGFTSLSYEVLWNRVLSLMLRNTVYAFSTMLSTFLAGLFLGSVLIGRYLRKHPSPYLLALLQLGIGIYALAVNPVFGKLNAYFCYLELDKGAFGQSWAAFAAGQFLLCAVVMLAPAVMMGAVFPLLCELKSAALPGEGVNSSREVGRLYAWNTLGAVAGCVVSTFMLIPLLGTHGGVILTAALNIILGLCITAQAVAGGAPLDTTWAALVIVGFLFGGWGATWDPVFSGSIEEAGEELLFREEDYGSLIEVTRNVRTGARILISNRQQQEGDSSWPSVYNQRFQVYLPLFLHPRPCHILGVGLGTGISFAALTHYTQGRAECVELSAGVLRALPYFASENNDLARSRVKIVRGDGRNYLRLIDKKYDLIIADLFSSYRAGVGNLYSREHYLRCRERLAPGGIMCQWLPPHQLPGDSLRIIVNTFRSVFPHTSLWLSRQAIALIATPRALRIDYRAFLENFQDENLLLDLEAVGLDNPYAFLDTFVMGEKRLARYGGDTPLNCDDKPLVEFIAPREFYRLTDAGLFEQHVAEVLSRQEDVTGYIKGGGEELLEGLEATRRAAYLARMGARFRNKGNYGAALQAYRQALELDKTQVDARRGLEEYYLAQGAQLNESGLYREGARVLEKALRRAPRSPRARLELGKSYLGLGNYERAREEFLRAREADPYHPRLDEYLKETAGY